MCHYDNNLTYTYIGKGKLPTDGTTPTLLYGYGGFGECVEGGWSGVTVCF
jgi:prolyl oligopeptidase PreP (S9A serine peptidase family)